MCFKIVSKDCKKLQLLWFYVNKPLVVRNWPYKNKKVRIHMSHVIFTNWYDLWKSVLWAKYSFATVMFAILYVERTFVKISMDYF